MDQWSDDHLVGTKHGLLKCRSVRRKPPGEQWSRRETVEAEGRNGVLMWKWTLEYLDHRWPHVQMKGCQRPRHRRRFPEYLRLHLCPKSTCPKCQDKECTRKHSGSEPSCQKSAELPVRGSHTLAKQNMSRWVGREPPNRISGGGEMWSCCRSRYMTTGAEWKFDGS